MQERLCPQIEGIDYVCVGMKRTRTCYLGVCFPEVWVHKGMVIWILSSVNFS